MSKLSTMLRDATYQTTRPQVGQQVLVWSSARRGWCMAYYTGAGEFEEWYRGDGRVVVGGRFWVPLPEPPE